MLDVIFENSEIIVVNKPAGLRVHADGKNTDPNLTDFLLQKYPEINNVGEPQVLSNGEFILRPGIVHRLDTETSGVMVVARTQESFLNLKDQFKKHLVQKTYHAFVYGELSEKEGVINRPIAKSKKDFRLWSAQRGGRGEAREAITEFRVIKSAAEVSFMELSPKTGRTHQLRVHLKAIHHPIVCDSLYAPKGEKLLGFERLALHSRKISLKILSGGNVSFQAPYSDDFQKALEKFAPEKLI